MEHEIKFAAPDLDRTRQELRRIGAVRLGRVFESNRVYDDAQGSLRKAGILLRLRKDGKNLLTVKIPPDAKNAQPGLKVLRELETTVADGEATDAILRALGYRATFAYEKIRETWDASCAAGVVHVCLDQLPFGDFLELEGPAEGLRAVAESMGFCMQNGLADTYHALHQKHLQAKKLPPRDGFVFAPEERRAILRELG